MSVKQTVKESKLIIHNNRLASLVIGQKHLIEALQKEISELKRELENR